MAGSAVPRLNGGVQNLVFRGLGLKEIPRRRLADFEDPGRGSNIPILVEARDWERLPERSHREIGWNYVDLGEGGDKR